MTMSREYIEITPGLVVSDDGEIVESAGITDPLGYIVFQRRDAYEQRKQWEQRQAILDAVILRKQQDKTRAYGETVVTLVGGSYSQTNTKAFAEAVYALPLELEVIFEVIAAADGFKRESLPPEVRQAFDEATQSIPKRAHVRTSVARRAAPPLIVKHDDHMLEELEASVAELEALEAGR